MKDLDKLRIEERELTAEIEVKTRKLQAIQKILSGYDELNELSSGAVKTSLFPNAGLNQDASKKKRKPQQPWQKWATSALKALGGSGFVDDLIPLVSKEVPDMSEKDVKTAISNSLSYQKRAGVIDGVEYGNKVKYKLKEGQAA